MTRGNGCAFPPSVVHRQIDKEAVHSLPCKTAMRDTLATIDSFDRPGNGPQIIAT